MAIFLPQPPHMEEAQGGPPQTLAKVFKWHSESLSALNRGLFIPRLSQVCQGSLGGGEAGGQACRSLLSLSQLV